MTGIFPGAVAAEWKTYSSPLQLTWAEDIRPRQVGLGPSFNVQEALADARPMMSSDNLDFYDDSVLTTAVPKVFASQHTDYHFRLWVFPEVLNLSNPQLGTNISFQLWNTWSDNETIENVAVIGSSVLTFDIGSGTVLRDGEIRTANFQIGAGEPNIDAVVQFITENLSGEMRILAAISDTFNLIPDVPVSERWNFKTDILVNHLGEEQRICLRRYPRMDQEFDVEIIDTRQRREQYALLRKNIVVQSLISFYQYSTVITDVSPIGSTKIWFDPKRTNMRVGEFLVAINTSTEGVFMGKVTSIDADGAVVNTAVGEEIDTRTWVVMPAFNCIVQDGSGITMNTVTGTLSIKAQTFSEPALVRPGATRTVDFFGELPFLNRRPMAGAAEDFEYRRDILDNETGARDLSSRDHHPRVYGSRRFIVQRVSDPDEMDYWRSFFDTIRGAQKSFLMSTFFPDLTLVDGQAPLGLGVSSFDVKEGESVGMFMVWQTWKRIQIEHSSGVLTQHRITSFNLNIDGSATLNFAPALPEVEGYRNPKIISFLMRWRAQDTVAWEHYANYSEVSFSVISTDE